MLTNMPRPLIESGQSSDGKMTASASVLKTSRGQILDVMPGCSGARTLRARLTGLAWKARDAEYPICCAGNVN